jgi:cysteine-rich repeat protein
VKLSLVLCSIIGGVLIVACASSGPSPQTDVSNTLCVPKQTLRCYCDDGIDDGTQVCSDDGKLSPCSCPTKKPSGTSGGPVPTGSGTTPPPPPPPPVNKCGDGNLDKGEACDDGNTTDGDGCSAKCQPDGAPASSESCPGQPLTLWQGSTLTLQGTTEGSNDDVQTSCVESNAPDRIYAIQPSADGFMGIDAEFGAAYDAVIEIRRDTCDSASAQVQCTDTFSLAFKNVVEVKANHTYYVIIDGDSSSAAGAYIINLTLP